MRYQFDTFAPRTPRLKAAFDNAEKFARECGHDYIGAEHLLVGIILLGDGLAFDAIKECVNPEALKEAVGRKMKNVNT